MAAHGRVYDSRHLQADCSGTLRSVIEYGLPFTFNRKKIVAFLSSRFCCIKRLELLALDLMLYKL